MIKDIQSSKDYNNSKLMLHHYADGSVEFSHYEVYEEDGEIFQANVQGWYELLSSKANQQSGKLNIQ